MNGLDAASPHDWCACTLLHALCDMYSGFSELFLIFFLIPIYVKCSWNCCLDPECPALSHDWPVNSGFNPQAFWLLLPVPGHVRTLPLCPHCIVFLSAAAWSTYTPTSLSVGSAYGQAGPVALPLSPQDLVAGVVQSRFVEYSRIPFSLVIY